MFRRMAAVVVVYVVGSLLAAGPVAVAAEGADERALRERVAELEKRIGELEKLLEKGAAEEARPGPERIEGDRPPRQTLPPVGPVGPEELPEWARQRLDELLDRGLRGELRIPGIGDLRLETLPPQRRAHLGVHIAPLSEEDAAELGV